MWYLTAAVVFVGALCIVDLILSLGIIRRLREHTAELERLAGNAGPPGLTTISVGTPVDEFAATTTGGTTLRRHQPDAPQRLFAFLSTGCQACQDQLPGFVHLAADYPDPVVAVVVHSAEQPDDAAAAYAARLAGVAEVVFEPHDGPIGRAFQVGGYPTWCLIDAAGVVLASGIAIDRIAVPALR